VWLDARTGNLMGVPAAPVTRDLSTAASMSGLLSSIPGSEPVGLLVGRSALLPHVLLALLSCGRAYVPLTPDLPDVRLIRAMRVAGVRRVVTDRGHAERAARLVPVESVFAVPEQVGVDGRLDLHERPEETAYVIFTSGSTGEPKGVEISRGALASYLDAMDSLIGTEAQQRWAAVTSLGFDISVTELVWAQSRGHDVTVLDGPLALIGCDDVDVTHLQITPTLLRLLLQDDRSRRMLGRLDVLLVGGEPFPADVVPELLLCTSARVVNMYGPTEATVWVSSEEVRRAAGALPIGSPFAHAAYYVLNEQLNPCQPDEQGRLFIGGASLARGYAGDPSLTARRFMPDPFSRSPGSRMYDTGDLATQDAAGSIRLRGRCDDQVKLSGHRVEPGDVEAALSALEGVTAAVVVVDASDDEACLHGYYTGSPDPEHIRLRLVEIVPEYMVPRIVTQLAALPRTVAGKVDRARLATGSRRTAPARTRDARPHLPVRSGPHRSVWPADLALPTGWQETGPVGTVEECLLQVETLVGDGHRGSARA